MTELYKDIQVTVTAKTGESRVYETYTDFRKDFRFFWSSGEENNYEEGSEKHFEKIIDCLRMVNFDGVSMTTASQFIQMIAADFSLNTGTLEDTGFVIASRVEDNTSLFDMIENALDLTLQNSKEMFVLYDDFGKLTLKNLSSMYVGEPGAYLMIDEETGENFEYTSSIDNDTYNKVKLTYDNEETGKREVYIAQDSSHMNAWGVLQYFDTLQKGENGQAKADALLKLYNSKTRNLKIVNALGDTRVRAGSMVVINLALGDMNLKNFMLVEKVKHTFKLDEHFMDLTLRGGEFIA